MHEKNEISIHEVRIWIAAQQAKGWTTAKEIADVAKVAGRTARLHLLKLSRLGLLDVAEVFPGHRYRVSEKADKRNAGYHQRITKAAEVFGLSL